MSQWLKDHTKSILVDNKQITINCDDTPVTLTIKVIELNYGPALDFKVMSDVPFHNTTDEHPFMYSKEYMSGEYKTGSIIDDTPAVRALIQELSFWDNTKLYTTTHCTHVARLIRAINGFWS
jgi:hypothetical protein